MARSGDIIETTITVEEVVLSSPLLIRMPLCRGHIVKVMVSMIAGNVLGRILEPEIDLLFSLTRIELERPRVGIGLPTRGISSGVVLFSLGYMSTVATSSVALALKLTLSELVKLSLPTLVGWRLWAFSR